MHSMHKKFIITLLVFVALILVLLVLSSVLVLRRAEAPVPKGITREIERRVFVGPKTAPYVNGPTEPAPKL